MENVIKTGTIPATAKIELESSTDQWKLFSRGFLKNFSTNGVILVDKESNKKVRVSITMLQINPPDKFLSETRSILHSMTSGFEEKEIEGVVRARKFFFSEIDKRTWFFLGYINGKKNIPIIILHYDNLDYTIYSVITDDAEVKKLFPLGMDSGMN